MNDEQARRVLQGERVAVATALNLIDARNAQRRARALPLLQALENANSTAVAVRIGLTGAPGCGKSTLIDALIGEIRHRGETVGVIAVDPSSRDSGGALLADRVRAQHRSKDEGVFFRSMAARDRLGGLAAASRSAVTVLSAAFDWVIVESVGVGQSEVEIADLVDTLIYVAQPGAGDVLQYMKAGLLELPDIFVVNKADLGPAAQLTEKELRRGLALEASNDATWQAPVLLAAASESRGIGALVDAIIRHRTTSSHEERLANRRRDRIRYLFSELADRYGSFGFEALGGPATVRKMLTDAVDRSEVEVLEDLSKRIETALRQ